MAENVWRVGRCVIRNGESVLHGEVTKEPERGERPFTWVDFRVEGSSRINSFDPEEWSPEYPPAPLPTEPGSVIVNATIRGVKNVPFAVRDDDGLWAARLDNGKYWHTAEHITYWEPGKVVPA